MEGVILRLMLALAVSGLAPAAANEPDRTAVHHAFQSLYSFQFDRAHSHANTHIERYPTDPMGHTVRAAIYLFYELDRLRILASEFFTDDRKIKSEKPLKPDPEIRVKFFAAVEDAERTAFAALARDPAHSHSLFALTLGEGMKTDYTAFVEKKQLRSLPFAKQSNKYAMELLRTDPGFVDAHLTTGLTEYLVGSLPFFVRWFVRFEGVEGDKRRAETNLKQVMDKGRYLGPFAEVLLCVYYLREKEPRSAIALLDGLSARFPANRLFQEELGRLREKHPEPAIQSGGQ